LRTVKIFNTDGWPVIKDEFDSSSDERLSRIQRFLEFLAGSFGRLFSIDSKRLDIHPFFIEVRDQLRNIIPGVSLDEKGGVLKRTGVRHVILRTKTAQLLIRSLQEIDNEKLFEIGKQIGAGAASDLIKNTVEAKQLIPASAEAFVTLWDYWDRTGGWGKLTLIKSSENNDAEPISQESQPPEWYIRIENNFLATENLKETHRLSSFWGGYIKGVLNEALPRINEIMSRKLDKIQRQKVTLPAYQQVVEVIHEEDSDLTSDTFKVRFKNLPFSDGRRILSNCQIHIQDGEYDTATHLCRLAVLSAKNELGPRFQAIFNKLEYEVANSIKQMINGSSYPKTNEATAQKWFEAANSFIQGLSE
jgi:hypothetical protein